MVPEKEDERNSPTYKPGSVFWKGKWYIAQYGQFDGYPEGQGVKVFNFLSVARNIDNLKEGLENHIYEPTNEEVDAIWDECEAWDASRRGQTSAWEKNMYGINQLYPSLARETSAGILGILARAGRTEEEDDAEDGAESSAEGAAEKQPKKIPVRLELEFANDTLFCEWAYVLDLDKEVLEVYGGGEKKNEGHRFKDVGRELDHVPAFVCSFEFSELYLMKGSDEFLAKVEKANDEKAGKKEAEDDESDVEDDEQPDKHEQVGEEEDEAEGSVKGRP